MIQFKLNGKKKQIPSSWEDLTFHQYLEILNWNGDYLKLVSLASGLDYEFVKKSEIIGLESIIKALTFINTKPTIPTSIAKIGKYKLPLDSKGQFNIQYKRLDQFEDMRQAMVKDSSLKGITESYPVYIAIYLQSIRDGEYDHAKAMDMVEEVKEMPALEVISLGSFFLIKQLSLLSGIKKTSPSTLPAKKKSKRASKTSKKSLARTHRLTGSRGL